MVIAPRMLRFLRDEQGPTAVEYAVMLALVLVAIITAINSVGDTTSTIWLSNSTKITTAISKGSAS